MYPRKQRKYNYNKNQAKQRQKEQHRDLVETLIMHSAYSNHELSHPYGEIIFVAVM